MCLNPKKYQLKTSQNRNFESKDLQISIELELTEISKELQIFVAEVIEPISLMSSR